MEKLPPRSKTNAQGAAHLFDKSIVSKREGIGEYCFETEGTGEKWEKRANNYRTHSTGFVLGSRHEGRTNQDERREGTLEGDQGNGILKEYRTFYSGDVPSSGGAWTNQALIQIFVEVAV